MERVCKYCGETFKPKTVGDVAEYCKTICWKIANGLAEADKHYNGGHKNMKRKKK